MNAQFQPQLIHETFADALRDAIRALGGTKKVGAMLWPEKSLEDAKNRVNDCLNPDRADKFSPDQVLLLLRAAREAGYHGAMDFIAGECGYTRPEPIAPRDELAQLQREYIAAVKSLQVMATRMERLAVPTGPRAVNQ